MKQSHYMQLRIANTGKMEYRAGNEVAFIVDHLRVWKVKQYMRIGTSVSASASGRKGGKLDCKQRCIAVRCGAHPLPRWCGARESYYRRRRRRLFSTHLAVCVPMNEPSSFLVQHSLDTLFFIALRTQAASCGVTS